MAPKRKAKGSGTTTTTTTTIASTAAATSPRRTRSATAAGKRVGPPPETKAAPPTKKPKRVAAEEKKDSKGKGKAFVEKEPLAPPPVSTGDGDASKTIIVEACKQCNSFKTRAIKVKDGLESAVPGVTVTINPEKIHALHGKSSNYQVLNPRRGCFEIREDGGEVFVSLLDMPRPFKPMKNLDMDKVIVDIAKKIT